MEICKATISMGDSTVTFEGPAAFVQAQVEKFSRAQESCALPASTIKGPAGAAHEQELIRDKRPRGHHEIVTVLAFALTEGGTAEFTDDDVRRAYIRAAVRPPKLVAQSLRDAKSKFDYICSGSRRGTYRLTEHGDRFVRFDLPRQN